jgi:hypothetical protein
MVLIAKLDIMVAQTFIFNLLLLEYGIGLDQIHAYLVHQILIVMVDQQLVVHVLVNLHLFLHL